MAAANPYDGLDEAPAPIKAGPVPATGGTPNPYDELDGPSLAAEPAADPGAAPATGGWKQAKLGAVSAGTGVGNMVEDMAGIGTIRRASHNLSEIFGSADPLAGIPTLTDLANRSLQDTGYNPDAPENQPQGFGEKLARGAGAGAASMLVPEAGVAGLIKAGATGAKALIPMVGAGTLRSLAANTARGAAAGAAGAAGEEVAPDALKPIAALVAGAVPGLGEAALAAGKARLGSAASKALPITKAQQEKGALADIYAGAENPVALKTYAETAPAEIIPGFHGTVGQETGDPGLIKKESVLARTDEGAVAFDKTRQAQLTAQRGAVDALQATGDPAATADAFRAQLDDIDKQHAALVDAATQAGKKAVGDAETTGRLALDAATTGGEAAITTATDAAHKAAAGVGTEATPEAIGGQLRGALERSEAAMKQREKALWATVPHDVVVVADPLREADARVYGNMTPEAKSELAPIESRVSKFIAGYGETLPFRRLNDLRQIINKGMMEAKSPLTPNTEAYGRLAQMRGAIEDAIHASLTERAAQDQQAVATGTMRPEDAMAAKMQAHFDEWKQSKSAAGVGAETGSGSGGAARPGAFSAAPGGKGQARGQPGGDAGGPGIQGDGGQRITKSDADALKAALAATKQRKELMGAGDIPAVMKRPLATSPNDMLAAAVPGKFWKPGPEGGQTLTRFLAAAQNSPEAIDALSQAAAASLQTRIKNGILTDQAFESWRGHHQQALRALETAKPGTLAKYQDAATAGKTVGEVTAATAQKIKDTAAATAKNLKDTKQVSEAAIDAAAAKHKQAVDEYQKSAVAPFLGTHDPADVAKAAGAMLNSVDKTRAVVAAASKSPAALEGLRKAIAEHIQQRFISNKEIGGSGDKRLRQDQFRTFIKDKEAALRLVMTPEQIQNLKAVEQSMMIADRADSLLVKGSGTAQLTAGMAAHDKGGVWHSILGGLGSHVSTAAAAGTLGFVASGGLLGGLATAAASEVLRALRSRGIANQQAIIVEALANPEFFRALNARVPKNKGDLISFRNRVLRAAVAGGIGGAAVQRRAVGN